MKDELTRFGVSIDGDLLKKFDRFISDKGYQNRSEALRDLIRRELNEMSVNEGPEPVYGVAIYVYDHGRKDVETELTDFQHHHTQSILFSNHIHIDHDNCLEVVFLRERPSEIQHIAEHLFSRKGVKLGKFVLAVPSPETEPGHFHEH